MLHDKRKNGRLASKIFNENRYPNKSDFKTISNEFDEEFNIYSQKLSFNTKDCKNISNKCYLLITYFGPYYLSNVIGTEYTLLTRIWNKYEFISQIVNIPLNEYVFGNFDEKSVNHHYYSVFIPEDSNITIEIHGYEIKAYAINGIKKINAITKKDDIYDLNYNGTRGQIKSLSKDVFTLKSFKNQYISFSFFREDRKLNNISYYYFRVLQPDSINNIIIYPLDSNFENLCEPDIKTNSCYFLLKNDYNELSKDLKIYELNDNAENFYKLNVSKNKQDYNSINLNNTKFKHYPTTSHNINVGNMDYYLILKIKSKLNYNTFLTISSVFIDIEPSIQIYSYKLIILYKKRTLNFKLDKAQQYKLKIINNMKFKYRGEIRIKKDNDIKDNINNDYGKQISYPINKDVNNLEIYSKNKNYYLTQFIKFDYKRPRKNIEEINYGATRKPIFNYEEFPVFFYIKHINDKGLDFNVLMENNIENLDISGYVVDFHSITKIDNSKKILNENLDNKVTHGIYDNKTQTGIIEFNTINENIRNIDIYYIVKIELTNPNAIQKNGNLSSRIVIEAYPREDKNNIIPPGKYIRGMFDLKENSEGKIYYMKDCNNCIIIFSSNYKNLQIVIDNNNNINRTNITNIVNNTNYTASPKNITLEYAQIYIIEGKIDKFTIKLINNTNTTKDNSPININYIFKYNDKVDMDFLKSKMEHSILEKLKEGNKRDIVISFFNNKKSKSKSKYSYYLRLYKESDIKKEKEKENLNTLAITSSIVHYHTESLNNKYYKKINLTLEDLSNDESYQGYLFIKRNNSDEEEYKVQNFTIKKKEESLKISLISVLIISLSLIFIIIAFFSICLMRIRKKNKELEEKVRNISFKDDDDDDSLNEDMNPKVNYV